MVPYIDIIGLCHSVAIVCEFHVMRHKWHEVAALTFQTHANYGTWSIDFDVDFFYNLETSCYWFDCEFVTQSESQSCLIFYFF